MTLVPADFTEKTSFQHSKELLAPAKEAVHPLAIRSIVGSTLAPKKMSETSITKRIPFVSEIYIRIPSSHNRK